MVRIPLRKRRSNWGLLEYSVHAVAIPIRFFYRIFITPLDRQSSKKHGKKFANDVAEIYETLLGKYGGKVIADLAEKPFDYASVRIDFPDRTFDIVRGRGEVSVSLLQLGERIEVFFEKMNSSDAQGIGALVESAGFVARCWDRLPEASSQELQRMRNERA